MKTLLNCVGLDYHEDTIRVCVMTPQGKTLWNRDVPNDARVVRDRVLMFSPPSIVALEACCGAANFAEELRRLTQWDVKLANPSAVNAMKRGADKTDHGDAFWLADLARVGHLPVVWQPDAKTRQLRRLVRYRQSLAKSRREIKQGIRGVLRDERAQDAPANPWTKKWLSWVREGAAVGEEARWVLDKQLRRLERVQEDIQEVEERMRATTQDDPLTQRLLAVKGIGLVTAVTMRAEIGCFERFARGKQLSRYCGLSPCNRSSGKRQADAGLIRHANHELRTVILETAHRLARYDAKWKQLKHHLIQRGKSGSVATAAVANRWLRWLYHQIVTKSADQAV